MSSCTGCGTELGPRGRFCPECGTPRQPAACPACGSPSAGGKFCAQCGTPLGQGAAAPPAPSPPHTIAGVSERRLTSVLFADLVGFTPLSESRDPEDVRELLSRYFERGRTVVSRYGGTVEKFIGDALMAVWGVPVAQEDDAERAVRAGLDLVAMVADLGDEVGAPGLRLRVGITTGEVAVTVGATAEGMVAGDAVNTAARVQALATPGAVWTDKPTRDLAAAAIEFADAGAHELKGKSEPVELHEARSVVAAVGGGRRGDGLEPPFVGRERQLRVVKELLHATVDEGRPRLLLVSGPAGVGKTRLAWEFEKYTDGLSDVFAWHRGRSRAYGDGSAFHALAEVVRSRLGMRGTEAPDAVIEERLPAFLPDEAERAWVGPCLATLTGGAERPGVGQDDLFAAWTRFLERAGTGGPVVVVLEDLQLADSGLLDFLDHLLATGGEAIFLLALARPELLERRPELLTNRRVSALHLEPLPDDAMAQLVGGVVGGLTDGLRATLVERAEGIPLYAVETVRALLDRGLVSRDDSGLRLADGARVDLEAMGAPASLHALVASRLDALPSDERRVVASASVLGMAFTADGLRALTGGMPELDDVIARLVRRDVLTVQSDRFDADRGRLRFVQSVVRQVAYDTLARRDRRAAHLAAAAHLEQEEGGGDLEPVIAHHLLDAVAASGEGDVDVAELTERAVELLVTAAERALALGAVDEAIRHLELALERAGDAERRVEVQVALAQAALQGGHEDRCIAYAEEVLAEIGDRDPVRAAVVATAAGSAYVDTGRTGDAIAMLEPRLAALGDDDAAQAAALDVLHELSRAHYYAGDYEAANRYSDRQLGLAERLGDESALAAALTGLAIDWLRADRPRSARVLVRGAVEAAHRTGQPKIIVRALLNHAAMVMAHDLRSGLRATEEAVALAPRASSLYRLYAYMNRVIGLYVAGSWTEARDLLAVARDEPGSDRHSMLRGLSQRLAIPCGDDPPPAPADALSSAGAQDLPWVWLEELHAARVRGDRAGIAHASAEGFAASVAYYGLADDFPFVWTHLVLASLEAGALDQAAAQIDHVAGAPDGLLPALIRAQRARFQGLLAAARGEDAEPPLREAIAALDAFGARPDAARTRQALGLWLAGRGREAEAAELLAAARVVYEELGAVAWLAELDESAVLPLPEPQPRDVRAAS